MKTRIMILACLLTIPASRVAAQQQTDPEPKATVQTQGDSIIIRKGKGDMRIKVYEEQLEDGEKKEVEQCHLRHQWKSIDIGLRMLFILIQMIVL